VDTQPPVDTQPSAQPPVFTLPPALSPRLSSALPARPARPTLPALSSIELTPEAADTRPIWPGRIEVIYQKYITEKEA
jgi:hypothetical protein